MWSTRRGHPHKHKDNGQRWRPPTWTIQDTTPPAPAVCHPTRDPMPFEEGHPTGPHSRLGPMPHNGASRAALGCHPTGLQTHSHNRVAAVQSPNAWAPQVGPRPWRSYGTPPPRPAGWPQHAWKTTTDGPRPPRATTRTNSLGTQRPQQGGPGAKARRWRPKLQKPLVRRCPRLRPPPRPPRP